MLAAHAHSCVMKEVPLYLFCLKCHVLQSFLGLGQMVSSHCQVVGTAVSKAPLLVNTAARGA